MKKLIIILFILININVVFSQVYCPKNLQFTVSSDKKNYLVDEPIFIEFLIQNISQEPTFISYPFGRGVGYFDYQVTHIDNTPLYSFGFSANTLTPTKCAYLLPGETIYYVCNILNVFGERDDNHLFRNYIEPGKYKIDAYYSATQYKVVEYFNRLRLAKTNKKLFNKLIKNRGYTFEHGDTLKSDILIFEVIEPQVEEKVARDELLKIYKIYKNLKYPEKKDKMDENFINFLKKNKESVYTKNAIIYVSDISKYNFDYSHIYEKFKNSIFSDALINKNKQSYLMEDSLGMLEDIKNLTPERIQKNILEYNNTHYKNTRLSKYTEYKYKLVKELNVRTGYGEK